MLDETTSQTRRRVLLLAIVLSIGLGLSATATATATPAEARDAGSSEGAKLRGGLVASVSEGPRIRCASRRAPVRIARRDFVLEQITECAPAFSLSLEPEAKAGIDTQSERAAARRLAIDSATRSTIAACVLSARRFEELRADESIRSARLGQLFED